MTNARVLIVDDEQEILELIQIVLNKEGFCYVETAATGAETLQQVRKFRPHIIVLDVMLPDSEGYDLCREIRKQSEALVIFLTARTTDLDKLTGFSVGGDDYLTKPFNPLELAARVKALSRRLQLVKKAEEGTGKTYNFSRFSICEDSGQLLIAGEEVPCPAMEFKLLLFLCMHPNRVFSKQQLYEQVWGEESMGDDNTVMVHIRRLREKIELDPGKPEWIVTVRGLGYKFVTPKNK